MKITFDLPDPIYQHGDVMRWGMNGLIVHIYRVEISGKWAHVNGNADAWVERSTYYCCTVQEGCGPEGDLIRPGTCTGCYEGEEGYDADNVHQFANGHAEKIEWNKPIIEPDTTDNLGERWKAWDELHPEQAASRASKE